MLLSKVVEIKWNSKIKSHYVDSGYAFTKMGDTFLVDVADLTNGSNVNVSIKCDYCGYIYTKPWYRYVLENKQSCVHKDCCSQCKKHKIKDACIQKYGVDNVLKLEDVQSRIKETNMQKYGCENPFSNEIVKEKIKQTNIQKFGVESPLQSKEVLEKLKNTCLSKYGVQFYVLKIPVKSGSENIRWKGGYEYHHIERATNEYITWRNNVFVRDHYTCQCCGAKSKRGSGSVTINAHHIFNWKDNEDKRYDVQNGITLCQQCHILFHRLYGKRFNTKGQIDEFLITHGKKIC